MVLGGGRVSRLFPLLIAVPLVLLSTTPAVHAQTYPTPTATVSASVSVTTAPRDASVVVSCRVTDAVGNGLEGVPCTFAILSQPGSTARFGNGGTTVTVVTDPGLAQTTLAVGATSGVITVGVSALGQSSQVLVQVTPQASAGNGGGLSRTGGSWRVLAAAGLAICLLGLLILRLALPRARERLH